MRGARCVFLVISVSIQKRLGPIKKNKKAMNGQIPAIQQIEFCNKNSEGSKIRI